MSGIDIMLSAIKKYDIDCDLVKQDSLFLGNGRRGWKDMVDEAESRRKLGFDYRIYNAKELRQILGSTGYSGAVRYQNTYGVNALRYTQSLKKVLLEGGVKIYESSEVVSVKNHTVRTHLGSVTADQMIFCADKLKPSLSRHFWNVYHEQTFLSISEPLNEKEFWRCSRSNHCSAGT